MEFVRSTCLYVATKLGDLLDEIVVVGGLVPHLLIDQDNLPSGMEPHVGTMDLDLGLALGVLDSERYRELAARMRDAGFQPEINDQGNRRLQTWGGGIGHAVTVDFLIPPSGSRDAGGTLHHIETDLAAAVTPGLDLAFMDRSWKEVTGRTPSGARATRAIPVCGPGAFTVLKALAFGNRAGDKDAYDLFYLWRGLGVRNVADSLASLMPSTHVDDALSVVERDFCSGDRLGPIGTAQSSAKGSTMRSGQTSLASHRRCSVP